MAWLYGIPDVSLSNHFVYFHDLLESAWMATEKGQSRKELVGKQAESLFENAMKHLDTNEKAIDEAVDFILKIAKSEQQKEIAVVKSYYKKIGEEFPGFKGEEDGIIKDPYTFYTHLTAEINKIRLGTQQYIDQLKQIMENSKGAKERLTDYFKDDYRFRLNSEATSLLKKMIGNYQEDKTTEATYTQKIQEIVLEIVKETVGKKLKKGEDFAAISIAVLADIEKEVENYMKNNKDKISDVKDIKKETLKILKKDYLQKIKDSQTQKTSATQRALKDMNSAEFLRITNNVKKILGIKSLDINSETYQKQLNEIAKQEKRRNNDSKKEMRAVNKIQKLIGEDLVDSFHQLTFTKLSHNSAHGDLFELIRANIEENGIKAGKYAATDVLSIMCNYTIKPDNKFIDNILNQIGQEMSNVIENNNEASNEKDLRANIDTMTKQVDTAIQKLEEKLKILNENKPEDFFIFHESLKLYSSVETDINKKYGYGGFGGRSLTIISYIDYMLSALDAAGINSPATRDMLIFLGLNLSDGAIGLGKSEPLARYFSIFAGLLMFDDVVAMTREAIEELSISTKTIKQVHLYNLNGIFVPASMILSYVGDALQVARKSATNVAMATINSNKATEAINNWKPRYSKNDGGRRLSPEDWQLMGAKVASSTIVKISFMTSFLRFIEDLTNL